MGIVEKIASLLKVDGAELQTAITEGNADFKLPELSVFTAEELQSRDKKLETLNYNKGRDAGSEMLIKELKGKYSVDIDGKDADKFMEAFKVQVLKDANQKPDSKIEELNGIITGLRTNITEQEAEVTKLKNEIRDSSLRSKAFAEVDKKFRLSNDKLLHLMTADGYSLDEVEGVISFRKNGEYVRDTKTLNVLPAKSIIEEYAHLNGLEIEAEEKRGRGERSTDNATPKATTYSQLVKAFEAQGKSINGQEFQAKAQELAKDFPDFMDK